MHHLDGHHEAIDGGLCTRCGACSVACEHDAISLDPASLLPVRRTARCVGCGACIATCPGRDPETEKTEQLVFGRGRQPSERWLGVCNRSVLARASDPLLYRASASGGSATALLLASRRQLGVDAVLATGFDPMRPWLCVPRVCRSEHEILDSSQSCYQLTNHLAALGELLSAGVRVGLVGLPCHVQAVRKLQRLNTAIGRAATKNLVFLLEVACSSSTLPRATERLITDVMGTPLTSVSRIRYREGPYPGRFCVWLKDGGQLTLPFWEMVLYFRAFKSRRCLTCPDWFSGVADISVCDGDPNIFVTSRTRAQSVPKVGRVYCRTAVGEALLAGAVGMGLLEVTDASPGETHLNFGLEMKKTRRARSEAQGGELPVGPLATGVPLASVIPENELLNLMARRHQGTETELRARVDGAAILSKLET